MTTVCEKGVTRKKRSTMLLIEYFTSVLYHRFYFQVGAFTWSAFISKINKADSLVTCNMALNVKVL